MADTARPAVRPIVVFDVATAAAWRILVAVVGGTREGVGFLVVEAEKPKRGFCAVGPAVVGFLTGSLTGLVDILGCDRAATAAFDCSVLGGSVLSS